MPTNLDPADDPPFTCLTDIIPDAMRAGFNAAGIFEIRVVGDHRMYVLDAAAVQRLRAALGVDPQAAERRLERERSNDALRQRFLDRQEERITALEATAADVLTWRGAYDQALASIGDAADTALKSVETVQLAIDAFSRLLVIAGISGSDPPASRSWVDQSLKRHAQAIHHVFQRELERKLRPAPGAVSRALGALRNLWSVEIARAPVAPPAADPRAN